MQRKWFVYIIGGGLLIALLALFIDDPEPKHGLTQNTAPAQQPPAQQAPATASHGGFQFTRTNFDDGWVSTVQPKWVEASKGDIRVLLHYPADVKARNTDPDVMANAAWDTLVAPRYRDLRNYKTMGSVLTYQRPYLSQGEVTDAATGRAHFVSIFNQADSGWIEVILPDRETFVREFGIDVEKVNKDPYTDTAIFNRIRGMGTYNKFAVAPADLPGKWTTNFSANTFYVNRYTGANAGMSTYSSGQEYVFSGQTYKWHIAAANSSGGQTKVSQAKSEGTFTMPDNWSMNFSDMEGKPKTYQVQFRAVEGGRILVIDGTAFVRAN
ncbi:hypothetical protein GJW-30_1_00362 [Variibacter gotjawalensis]|uniref:Uncharacterized protein n=1 Tax=Variibacter gotjawalensis TaxID=1333996 RepID=A0A0S3PPP6_9BRAD|nr:hypothetical protein [Variibacter gotjawalensis]NIK48149.1 hypothetical protein [Variibacter gotjawalensis]RZS50023.1 hypothetical protein EV661_2472 [Variibacter gotjawalensis]BAT57852.1 hypothetical protein GJW-30_1_00362 [Variibacter gotjawalensis]